MWPQVRETEWVRTLPFPVTNFLTQHFHTAKPTWVKARLIHLNTFIGEESKGEKRLANQRSELYFVHTASQTDAKTTHIIRMYVHISMCNAISSNLQPSQASTWLLHLPAWVPICKQTWRLWLTICDPLEQLSLTPCPDFPLKPQLAVSCHC